MYSDPRDQPGNYPIYLENLIHTPNPKPHLRTFDQYSFNSIFNIAIFNTLIGHIGDNI